MKCRMFLTKRVNMSQDQAYRLLDDLTNITPINPYWAFKIDYLKDRFLKKAIFSLENADSLHQKAISLMMESEAKCKRVNDGIDFKLSDSEVMRARVLIAKIIGYNPPIELFEHCRMSNGAGFNHSYRYREARWKWKDPDVTSQLAELAESFFRSIPARNSAGPEPKLIISLGNRITTVPKDNSINRCIAIEPAFNMMCQLATGTFIKNRLRRYGIDLYDQSRNQRLARRGSIDDTLATLDLKSASDSISERLVWELLPPSWFNWLNTCRSHYGIVDGTLHRWEKFSSMGNGFTFELESLIFFALTLIGCDLDLGSPDVSVYGDDIICPASSAPVAIDILERAGFTINKDKSYVTGPFRESCGGYYYRGLSVKPIRITGSPPSTPSEIIQFLNRLREWAFDEELGMCHPDVYPIWLRLRRKYIPSEFLGGGTQMSVNVPGRSPYYNLIESHSRKTIGDRWDLLVKWQPGSLSPYASPSGAGRIRYKAVRPVDYIPCSYGFPQEYINLP